MVCAACGCHSAISEGATAIVGNAAIGYAASAAFLAINPVAGAVFGVFAGVTYSLIELGVTSCIEEESTCIKTFRIVLSMLTSILIGAAATATLGFSLTLATGAFLTGCMIFTTLAIHLLFQCSLRMPASASP
jgi:hypothetical protein